MPYKDEVSEVGLASNELWQIGVGRSRSGFRVAKKTRCWSETWGRAGKWKDATRIR